MHIFTSMFTFSMMQYLERWSAQKPHCRRATYWMWPQPPCRDLIPFRFRELLLVVMWMILRYIILKKTKYITIQQTSISRILRSNACVLLGGHARALRFSCGARRTRRGAKRLPFGLDLIAGLVRAGRVELQRVR